ncbi:MAG: hypothetical protein AAFQ84_10260 [Pseudomonadota bacterium]
MTLDELITAIEEHAQASGRSISDICRQSTGNSRLYSRLCRRRDQTIHDADRVLEFIKAEKARGMQAAGRAA